jgi:predicted carbohydrate-binding protein with CBM5 and CBM33 domain
MILPMLQLKRRLYLSCILLLPSSSLVVLGHGYLSSPRSRNYYANQMTKWSNPTANDPEPETEPQSLNQGTLCGAIGNKDYNAPRNALGGPMKTTIQANWTSGQEVIVEVVLTAHHKVCVCIYMMYVLCWT